jgi:flagellar assembly protein FliH
MASYPLEQLEPSPPPAGWAEPDSPVRLLQEATAEAERIRAQARAEGYAAGLTEGREAGAEQARQAAEALDGALVELARRSEELLAAAEADAVELALQLAAKIVSGTVEVQPRRVLDVVAGALRRLTERREVVVLVAPEDLELVSERIEELQAHAGGIERCELLADRRVGRGGAIVRTRESEVDAKVATQLERARELVCAELGAAEG